MRNCEIIVKESRIMNRQIIAQESSPLSNGTLIFVHIACLTRSQTPSGSTSSDGSSVIVI